jgi:hypothetical protein
MSKSNKYQCGYSFGKAIGSIAAIPLMGITFLVLVIVTLFSEISKGLMLLTEFLFHRGEK